MRSLLSPLSRTRSATDAASPTPPASDSPPACSTPGPGPCAERHSIQILHIDQFTGGRDYCKPTPVAATKPDLLATTNSLEVPTPVASSGASDADELALKEQIRQLNVDLMRVVNHSIESDTRLLRHTNDIFVARSSLSGVSAGASVRDCAVQCEPPGTTCCQVSQCSKTRDLVTNLRTTIQVLEAEIECLRAEREVQVCSCGYSQATAIDLNLYKKQTKNHPFSKPSQPLMQLNKNIPNVVIEGDSNTRFLACIVQRRVSSAAKVTGICKPGAKLLNVTSSSPSPPSSCFILLARTNDIAAGESHNIYNRLEERVTVRLSSADVILAMIFTICSLAIL
ncbi:hypothetical protein J6590_102715 [Homalodisca vitripennis]|nr:hypothetical protein J6590_102715 [Homalodisca vitripennis]